MGTGAAAGLEVISAPKGRGVALPGASLGLRAEPLARLEGAEFPQRLNPAGASLGCLLGGAAWLALTFGPPAFAALSHLQSLSFCTLFLSLWRAKISDEGRSQS